MSTTISADQRILALLPTWYELLQQWSIDGRLKAAAKEALLLSDEPEQLKALTEEWAAGDFSGLPLIVLLPASLMPGAAGAYAISTRTIYINQDWLQSASSDAAMAVLTEELGHHLDELLNVTDTPGDEGELFMALLQGEGSISEQLRQVLISQSDHGSILVEGQELAVEQAAQVVSTPIPQIYPGRTSSEYRNLYGFAALRSNGSVVTWGDPDFGGDSSLATSQLRSGVVQIFSSQRAFAALKSNGSVVSWGNRDWGGDSSAVANKLRSGVVNIFSTNGAFAAIKSDGSVVTWGKSESGGESSAVASELRSGVVKIFSTDYAFAAIKTDGSIVSWGLATQGGGSNFSSTQLSPGVVKIFANAGSFVALKNDGSLTTWGSSFTGGFVNIFIAPLLRSGVVNVFSTNGAFAAIKSDGSVVTWGDPNSGGDSSSVAAHLLSGVTKIFSSSFAFAALKSDGSVITWGDRDWGGDSSLVASQLRSGVTQIFATGSRGSFAALKSDGSVVTWGSRDLGGDSSSVANQLRSGVVDIFSTDSGFAALKADGSVVTWGIVTLTPAAASQLRFGVSQIFSNSIGFAALKNDGSVVTFGSNFGTRVPSTLTDVVAFANPFTDDRLILDVQPVSTLTITPLSANKAEGNSTATNFTFTVSRSGDLAAESTASWSVAGSGVNPANQADFPARVLPSGTVRFLAGQSARNITVRVAGDTTFEADETFTVSLSDPAGASINPEFSSATGTIRNDDAPPLPELAIAATDANKPEGFSGNTPFTFTVTRTGDTTAASSANWAVSGIGANTADAADFARGVLPSGTVRFSAGQASSTITVDVRAGRLQERDERFQVTLSNPTGATITTASASGIIRNDDLIGTTANNTITGTTRPEFIDGLTGQDFVSGGVGPDRFGFRFGHSRIGTPDRITDFRFGTDLITLLNAQGQLRPAPVAFSRAANNSTADTLADLAAAVFADADGRTAGNQPLAANAAALVRSTNAAIAGTYLLINDANAGRSLTADLMVNITGFSGTLPALGVRPVESVFA